MPAEVEVQIQPDLRGADRRKSNQGPPNGVERRKKERRKPDDDLRGLTLRDKK